MHFPKMERNGRWMDVLTSSQTNYLTNLDGATDRVTSQSSERIQFYCNAEKLQKCLHMSNSSVIIFVWTESSLFRQTLMLQWYLIKVSLTLHILRCIMVQSCYRWRSEVYSYTRSSFKIRITNMFLASCNTCSIRMLLRKQFFTYWKDRNIPNIKKQNRRTEKIWSTSDNFPHSL